MNRLLPVLLFSFAICSCNKKDDNTSSGEPAILSYRIESSDAHVSIAQHNINIAFDDTVTSATSFTADFTLSNGCKATVNSQEQISGVSKNNYNAPFVYVLTANGNSSVWTVNATNNSYSQGWGLGGFVDTANSSNRIYPWYFDQLTTGFDSLDNCGPTVVTMACKWTDSAFSKTPEDARKAYEPSGGWWSTQDIYSYLLDNNVTCAIVNLPATVEDTKEFLKKQIDVHQIVILNIDMNYIRQSTSDDYHVDKFYSTTPNWGHFFIVKGYKVVDGEIFFEIYDPNSWGQRYPDGSFKGEDRYYRAEDVFGAASIWWQFAYIIAKKGKTLINKAIPFNIKNLPVQYGR